MRKKKKSSWGQKSSLDQFTQQGQKKNEKWSKAIRRMEHFFSFLSASYCLLCVPVKSVFLPRTAPWRKTVPWKGHGRGLSKVTGSPQVTPRWLVPVCVVLALRALPLATMYGCVKSVLLFHMEMWWRPSTDPNDKRLTLLFGNGGYCSQWRLFLSPNFLTWEANPKPGPYLLCILRSWENRLRQLLWKEQWHLLRKLQWLCRFSSRRSFPKWHFVQNCYASLLDDFRCE